MLGPLTYINCLEAFSESPLALTKPLLLRGLWSGNQKFPGLDGLWA